MPDYTPDQLRQMAQAAAQAQGLDPDIFNALINNESGWNVGAQSGVGAKGLTQLMDPTAAALGVTDPNDPQQNLTGGAKYLKQMLDMFGGDYGKALTAYNWGPGNLRNAAGDVTKSPAETQAYVARILGARGKGGGALSLAAAPDANQSAPPSPSGLPNTGSGGLASAAAGAPPSSPGDLLQRLLAGFGGGTGGSGGGDDLATPYDLPEDQQPQDFGPGDEEGADAAGLTSIFSGPGGGAPSGPPDQSSIDEGPPRYDNTRPGGVSPDTTSGDQPNGLDAILGTPPAAGTAAAPTEAPGSLLNLGAAGLQRPGSPASAYGGNPLGGPLGQLAGGGATAGSLAALLGTPPNARPFGELNPGNMTPVEARYYFPFGSPSSAADQRAERNLMQMLGINPYNGNPFARFLQPYVGSLYYQGLLNDLLGGKSYDPAGLAAQVGNALGQGRTSVGPDLRQLLGALANGATQASPGMQSPDAAAAANAAGPGRTLAALNQMNEPEAARLMAAVMMPSMDPFSQRVLPQTLERLLGQYYQMGSNATGKQSPLAFLARAMGGG